MGSKVPTIRSFVVRRASLVCLCILMATCGEAERAGGDAVHDASADKVSPPDTSPGDIPRDPACAPTITSTQRDVPYLVRGEASSDARTRLDIHMPPAQSCDMPIVIWVHGGAWQGGDKANQMEDKVPFFAQLGVVFVSVNYRLSSADNDVRHPDHVEDVAAAVAWVRARAPSFGGDPSRIALLGHSAGAHLVALLATNPRFLAAHQMAPPDLACVGSYDSEYTVADIIARDEAYRDVFTDDPALWLDASPSAHIGPARPPIQLACRGSAGRREQCEALADALRAAGNEALTIDASSLDHEGVNDAIGQPDDQVMTPSLRAFLDAHLLAPRTQ